MKNLKIYFTSDTHGHVLPVDYATGKKKHCGLLNIAAEIQKDGNTLVLDGGDSLQGTPFVQYYLEHKDSYTIHPVAEGFRSMGLDVYTLGNHDFNFGYDVIRDYTKAMQSTLVCANVEDKRGELPLHRYVIKTLENGLRVGITGAVTDHVNVWEKKENLTELAIAEPVMAVQSVYEEMKEQCDLTICIYHGGYEEDLETGKLLSDSTENIACRMARECSFDVLLTGHQHMPVEGIDLYGSWSVQAPAYADGYVSLEIQVPEGEEEICGKTTSKMQDQVLPTEAPVLENKGEKSSKNHDRIICSSEIHAAGENTLEIPAEICELEAFVQKWLDEPIGELAEEILPEEKLAVGLYGSRVAAFFNEVMLANYEADIACSALGNMPTGIPKSISIRDVYTVYMFANVVSVKELTGRDLKAALERCACYLDLDDQGKPYVGDTFLQPKVELYNYDLYAGLDYAFDLRKPHGERVVRLNHLDGTPVLPEEKLRLVTSDYRGTGTGGYEMIGNSPLLFAGADNVQDLLIDYIRTHHPVEIPKNAKFEAIY